VSARAVGSCGVVAGELAPGADPELPVGVREVGLDGLCGDEERLGDLRVGCPVRGDVDDPLLAWGQLVPDALPRHSDAARGQLHPGELGERGRAAALRELESLARSRKASKRSNRSVCRRAAIEWSANTEAGP
jgi:hypothetical protein